MTTILLEIKELIIDDVWLGTRYRVLVNGKEYFKGTHLEEAKAEAFTAASLQKQPVILEVIEL